MSGQTENPEEPTVDGTVLSPDRDFDRDPTEGAAAPLSPDEAAREAAVEEDAQADAKRARQRLLRELASREIAPAAAPAGLQAEVPEPQAPFAPTAGKERWPVKTVTDEDQDKITPAVQDTTVDALLLLERPADMPLKSAVSAYQSHRAPGAETTKWRVPGTIIAYKWEQDGDFHIVLQSQETGYTMIVEVPQDGVGADGRPFVDPSSPFKTEIEDARQRIADGLAQRGPTPSPQFVNASIPARVTGLGFFDIFHGQSGVATTNAIEIHPILDIEFLDQGALGENHPDE